MSLAFTGRVNMRRTRKIRKAMMAKPTIEGAGVHLKRAFGFSEVPMFDPFLLLDDFRSDTPEHYLKGSLQLLAMTIGDVL